MARSVRSRTASNLVPRRPSPRTLLMLLVWVLVFTSVAPLRWVRWTSWLSGPVTMLTAPIQHPVRAVSLALRSSDGPGAPDATLAALTQERDRYQQNWLQAKREIEDLRAQIRELSRGVEINPTVNIRQTVVPVIGGGMDPGSRSLKLKAGRHDGVAFGDVAVNHGVHIVGRIARAEDRSSTLLLITDPAGPARTGVQGVVMIDEDHTGPTCNLRPLADGQRLAGKTTDTMNPATNAPGTIAPGMTVRLQDSAWPLSAQMLILGRVESVEPDRENPLRPYVIVKPVYGLERLAEVVLRTAEVGTMPTAGADGQSGAGGAGGATP